MIKVVINGAAGRMGKTLIRLAREDGELELAGTVDVGGRLSELITKADVVIDFSTAPALTDFLDLACDAGKALVIGTTGHTPEQKVLIKKASAVIPILISPNMSVGVNLLLKLAEIAGKTLDESFIVDIKEKHHIHKKDSPSGTAKKLAEVVSKVFKEPASIEAAREGEVVGEHTISFTNDGEKIELSHAAFSREIFARGALKAAKWIVGRPAGIYDMGDTLDV